MRTGLITFHYAHHYGAQLQAYALMKAIMSMGADCEIINYVREDTIEGSSLFRKGLSVRALASNTNTLLNYRKLKRRFDRFESFVKDDMRLSEEFYGSYEELVKDAPEYDIYVCGSDQIWNPLIYREGTFDPAFFAEFARSGRRVAYAPSFGIETIPEDKREELKGYLDRFEKLSVREKQGEKIIREVSGREALTVLDPTLLLTGGDWSGLSTKPVFREPYLLCYFITDGRKYSRFVKQLSEKYGLPVVSLCGARRVASPTRYRVLDAGPREFIGLFENASFVCTDSFHGTVFSINFEKEFFCFESSRKAERSVNSRLHSILDRLGLLSRLIACPATQGIDGGITEAASSINHDIAGESDCIDYKAVGQALEAERELSLRYLKEALTL